MDTIAPPGRAADSRSARSGPRAHGDKRVRQDGGSREQRKGYVAQVVVRIISPPRGARSSLRATRVGSSALLRRLEPSLAREAGSILCRSPRLAGTLGRAIRGSSRSLRLLGISGSTAAQRANARPTLRPLRLPHVVPYRARAEQYSDTRYLSARRAPLPRQGRAGSMIPDLQRAFWHRNASRVGTNGRRACDGNRATAATGPLLRAVIPRVTLANPRTVLLSSDQAFRDRVSRPGPHVRRDSYSPSPHSGTWALRIARTTEEKSSPRPSRAGVLTRPRTPPGAAVKASQ